MVLVPDGIEELARADDPGCSAELCGEVFPIATDQVVGPCGHRDF